VGLYAPHALTVHSYVPNVSALMSSTLAIYELVGNAARVILAALHLRRQSA
jgi:hypothetical protein